MKLKHLFIAVIGLLSLDSCKSKLVDKQSANVVEESTTIQRYGMVTRLKPEKLEYYKQLHANAWPEVLKKIKECNIQNYSIYLQEIDGKYFLFSYFEYVGTDFDMDVIKMEADSTTQRWLKETDPCQLPLPEALCKGQIWTNMEEVFNYHW